MHPKPRRVIAKETKLEQWDARHEAALAKLGLSQTEAKAAEMRFQGRLVWPGEADYDQARREYDPQYNEFPAVVAYCETIDDAAWCLDLGKRYALPLACRSGGHSTAGYSVVTGGIVIDTSKFDHVVVDPAKNTATVGVGVDFQMLNNQLTAYGLHVPGGECLDVHVGGYFQGGGYGFTSREFGMNCDNVISARVLSYTEQGIRLVTANNNYNRDLFWAIRGGTGNNFGVVIDVTYQCHSVSQMWGFMLEWDDLEHVPAALYELQNNYTRSGAPDKFGSQAMLFIPDGKTSLSLILSGIYNGSEEEGRAVLEPLMKIGQPRLTAYNNNYAWLNAHIFPDPHLPSGTHGFPPEIKDSRYISKPIDLPGWQSIVSYFVDTLPKWNVTNAIFFEYYGGAINARAHGSNAFIHRDVYMDIYLDSFYYENDINSPQRADAIEWLNGYVETIERTGCTNGHSYQNYPRRDNPEYQWMYWGTAFWSLLPVKQKFDPYNLLDYPQGIKPPENEQLLVCTKVPPEDRKSIFPDTPIVFDEGYIDYLSRQ